MSQKHLSDNATWVSKYPNFLNSYDLAEINSILNSYKNSAGAADARTLLDESVFRARLGKMSSQVFAAIDIWINKKYPIGYQSGGIFGGDYVPMGWKYDDLTHKTPVQQYMFSGTSFQNQKKLSAYGYVYTKLEYIDQQLREYQLLNIDTGSSNFFESFRSNVLVPAASVAADIGAVATVAGVGYAAYAGISAALAASAVPAAQSGGALLGQQGLLGSSSLVTAPTAPAIVSTGLSLGSTSQVVAGGGLLSTLLEGATEAGENLLEQAKDQAVKQLIGSPAKSPQTQQQAVSTQQLVATKKPASIYLTPLALLFLFI